MGQYIQSYEMESQRFSLFHPYWPSVMHDICGQREHIHIENCNNCTHSPNTYMHAYTHSCILARPDIKMSSSLINTYIFFDLCMQSPEIT